MQRQSEELENRKRRNNLRIYGLTENEEGGSPIEFFKDFWPKLLGLPISPPLNIQRAHRLGPKMSGKTRGVIILFLEHTDLLKVLEAVKSKKRIVWHDQALFFTQDVAKVTADRRKKFLGLRPQLRLLNARFG